MEDPMRLTALILGLAAATATAAPAGDSPLVGAWVIIATDAGPVPDGAEATLTVAADGAVSGRAACNRFAGQVTAKGDTVTFAPMAATKMACPGALMETEAAIFAALDRVRGLVREGDVVRLVDDSGTVSLIVLAPAAR
jgi:putative lipoprotein